MTYPGKIVEVDNDKIGRCMGECDVMAEEALMAGKVNRNDLLMIARELREEGLSVMGGRNTQYADADSPFRNFQEAAAMAGISTEQAILYSIAEDLVRIKLAVERGSLPITGRDWFVDAHNFLDLLYAEMVNAGKTATSSPVKNVEQYPFGTVIIDNVYTKKNST